MRLMMTSFFVLFTTVMGIVLLIGAMMSMHNFLKRKTDNTIMMRMRHNSMS
ncbi:exported hypothetical protein [uncultured Dysgonomonas sp.]|uniref:Uncharacterized protein n=1 Tax=uncultured Dysgonomonas sp. TaxID=206096 RepID=A0A212JF23_9BACT|nr:exported hypothetical protein [uncultured Dysgonomonas sp.]